MGINHSTDLTLLRTAMIQSKNINKCLQACGEKVTLLQFCWGNHDEDFVSYDTGTVHLFSLSKRIKKHHTYGHSPVFTAAEVTIANSESVQVHINR